MIRGTNGVFVVFDNHQSVAEILKTLECGKQPVIVTLMETNTRFIEHVQNTGESSADLGGRRMCWASPPERVVAGLSRLR